MILLSGIQEGSLIFVENSNRIVAMETHSSVTHVAIVLRDQGKLYVYESTPPKVRKILLSEYQNILIKENPILKKKIRICVALPPSLPFWQILEMRKYAESQLGRTYSVKSYLSEKPNEGIHCGEFAVNAMKKAEILKSVNASATAPADLWVKVQGLYTFGDRILIYPAYIH